MFNKRTLSVLRDDMSFDIEDLMLKLYSRDMSRYIADSVDAIEDFVAALDCKDPKDSREKIVSVFTKHTKTAPNPEFKEFIDSMWHAFIFFSQGGMRSLFRHQENEAWYPKIQLKQIIVPNDIHDLDQVIYLYRGCDLSEHKNNKYGQSWSTSECIAREFAFIHYCSTAWFTKESRRILSAIIDKEHVLFSDQEAHEREVVVVAKKLRDVRVRE